ncbi:MAG: Ig-like domain-containing protein, partial [Terriglobales bacterium]
MRRLAGVGLFLIFLLSFGLSGCGGGGGSSGSSGSTIGPPAKVELFPSELSMEPGAVAQLSARITDANDKQIFTVTPTFSSSNPNITVSNNGLVCAGIWDSLSTPVDCKKTDANNNPLPVPATSNLTAAAGGITSNVVVAFVHLHVDNITLSSTLVDPCTSQNGTQIFTATAFNGGNNITSTVGTFSWLSSDGSVATIDVAGPATTPPLTANQAQVKAKNSGLTNITASVSGTISVPAPFITCSPATISIHVQNAPDTSFSIATSATKQLAADVVDTLGVTITGLTLTWNTSQPAIATVNTSGLVTGVAPGVSVITASCTPSSCNPGLDSTVFSNQVYSNPVTATITGTAAATTVYATTTAAIGTAGGHTDLIPINTSTNTTGTAIALPTDAQINSLLINPAGTRAFLG